MALNESRYWEILLHLHDTLSGRCSRIDDPDFFIAPDGKCDAKKELYATIDYFFDPAALPDPEKVCQFSGRVAWLKEVFHLRDADVPWLSCPKMDALRPAAATVIFPNYFINNPSSMFGHTLIRLKTGYDNALLAHAVTYSAHTDETNGLVFAYKGIFGEYPGYYTILPYYKKLQEYADMDKRDVWEYDLDLSVEEIERLTRHIRELEDISSDYYFFKENCSFNLLYLIEAARPDLHFTDDYPLYAIPIDTVRDLEEEGLVREVHFRPSKATQVQIRRFGLTDAQEAVAFDLAEGRVDETSERLNELPKDTKIQVLDLAVAYLQYTFTERETRKSDYTARLVRLLRTRSKLGQPDQPFLQPPVPVAPHAVHDSARLRFRVGSSDGTGYVGFGWRPALSDLSDPEMPIGSGHQLHFLDTEFRFDVEDHYLKLHRLDIVDLFSIAPRDRFFRPVSWRLGTRLDRVMQAGGQDALVWEGFAGGGLGYQTAGAGMAYALLMADIVADNGFENGYALGTGIQAGWFSNAYHGFKWHMDGSVTRYLVGDVHTVYSVSVKPRLKIARNWHLFVDGQYTHAYDDGVLDLSCGVDFFF